MNRSIEGSPRSRLALPLWIVSVAVALSAAPVPGHTTPSRVVSMNVCTDQLAMLIAAEGQLYSVSNLASDPRGSVLAHQASRYFPNNGYAEEIFSMGPDLVLTGTFTGRTSASMLRRLGIRVEEFAPAYDFVQIKDQIRQMGRLLNRQQRAEELVEELDNTLAGLETEPEPTDEQERPLAALHYLNGYTSGFDTLAGEVVRRSGFRNLGSELGIVGTVHLPLEILVMSRPDVIIAEQKPDDSQVLAYDTFAHPALQAVTKGREFITIPDKFWVCGAPFTAEAVRILSKKARSVREHGR